MGRLVQLWKISESEDEAHYEYGPGPDHVRVGQLLIDKVAQDVRILTTITGMSERDSYFFYGQLAEAGGRRMLRRAEFPDAEHVAV